MIKNTCIYKDFSLGVINVIVFFANSELKYTNELIPLIKRFPALKSKKHKIGLLAKNYSILTDSGIVSGMISKKKESDNWTEENKNNFRTCFTNLLKRKQFKGLKIGILNCFKKEEIKEIKRIIESIVEATRFEGEVSLYV